MSVLSLLAFSSMLKKFKKDLADGFYCYPIMLSPITGAITSEYTIQHILSSCLDHTIPGYLCPLLAKSPNFPTDWVLFSVRSSVYVSLARVPSLIG